MSESQAPPAPTLAAIRAGFVHAEELPRANKPSIAALVLGVAGAALSMVPFVGAAAAAVGLALGIFGLWDRGGRTRSKAVAVVAIVIAGLGVFAGAMFTVAEESAWHLKPCNQQAQLGTMSRTDYRNCVRHLDETGR